MIPKRTILLMLAVVSLLASAACRFSATATPAPTPFNQPLAGPLPPGQSMHTLTHDGRQRSYILYIPASVDWNKPLALVFVLHGGTGNAASAVRMSGFDPVADQYGFAVVYPDGTGRFSDDTLLTWNGGNCCGYAQQTNVDDVGFMRAIVSDLQSQSQVDPRRIYASGMSNGAILAQRLACQAADLFAAVAPVSGTLNFSPCNPSGPISVIEFHGTADQHIPYEGGYGPKSLVNVDFASVTESIGFWVSQDGCNPQPQSNSFADIRHQSWAGCSASSAVELYTIVDGGHAWPGGARGTPDADPPTTTISASSLIWQFFDAHPKP